MRTVLLYSEAIPFEEIPQLSRRFTKLIIGGPEKFCQALEQWADVNGFAKLKLAPLTSQGLPDFLAYYKKLIDLAETVIAFSGQVPEKFKLLQKYALEQNKQVLLCPLPTQSNRPE